jgi:hypothetical protein
MKQTIFKLGLAIGVLATTAFMPQNTAKKIVGKWESSSPDGKTILHGIFRPNLIFSGDVNGKVFVYGKFTASGDTLTMLDNSCGGSPGVYTVSFYAKDSVRFTLVSDTCTDRRGGTDGLAMKRMGK